MKLLLLFTLSAVLALGRTSHGQDATEKTSDAAALRDKWQQAYRSVAQSIEMRRGQTPLTLHDSALLFYTNPVRTIDQHGAIFLWTDEGRPAVFGSIWSAINRDPASRNVTHEWHSLLESGDVGAYRNGAVLWSCEEPGITWQMLADTPPPAASRPARLVQMRNIARRLAVSIEVDEESDLRLMTQPLYRYPEEGADAIDGALFAYTMATDPELLVLVEARGAGENAAWSVAFARFGARAMTVKEGERTIWSCELARAPQRKGKYYLVWRAEQMAAEPGVRGQETGVKGQ